MKNLKSTYNWSIEARKMATHQWTQAMGMMLLEDDTQSTIGEINKEITKYRSQLEPLLAVKKRIEIANFKKRNEKYIGMCYSLRQNVWIKIIDINEFRFEFIYVSKNEKTIKYCTETIVLDIRAPIPTSEFQTHYDEIRDEIHSRLVLIEV